MPLDFATLALKAGTCPMSDVSIDSRSNEFLSDLTFSDFAAGVSFHARRQRSVSSEFLERKVVSRLLSNHSKVVELGNVNSKAEFSKILEILHLSFVP